MQPFRPILSYLALVLGSLILVLVVGGVLPDESAAIGFAAMIFGLADSSVLFVRWLGGQGLVGRVLLALGAVSYSTYLCHFLIRAWVRFALIRPDISPVTAFAVYIVLTALLSPVLYLLIERPGRKLGRALVGTRPPIAMVPAP
jgi:peptidoglycan/LPS O-acetylase OafA/YrhL